MELFILSNKCRLFQWHIHLNWSLNIFKGECMLKYQLCKIEKYPSIPYELSMGCCYRKYIGSIFHLSYHQPISMDHQCHNSNCCNYQSLNISYSSCIFLVHLECKSKCQLSINYKRNPHSHHIPCIYINFQSNDTLPHLHLLSKLP